MHPPPDLHPPPSTYVRIAARLCSDGEIHERALPTAICNKSSQERTLDFSANILSSMTAPVIYPNTGRGRDREVTALSRLLVAYVTSEQGKVILACDGALNGRALGTEHLIQ